jgi:hypothetical protein
MISTSVPTATGAGQATAAGSSLPPTYCEEEYFFGGTATSYALSEGDDDGARSAIPRGEASYRSRMIVRRPIDPTAFSGVVLMEWLNVTAGVDGAPEWGFASAEMTRRGHVWVGVSAQQVGVIGGTAVLGEASRLSGGAQGGLVGADPERYGSLEHPGDAFCFDIFTQAARALCSHEGPAPLGDLVAVHVIAIGESQSGTFLATYVNAVHPTTPVFDGFLIHSRLGAAPSLEGVRLGHDGPSVLIRSDIDVPVLQFATETDLTVLHFAEARQDDFDLLRTWEVAGTAHADRFLINQVRGGGLGVEPAELLGCSAPVNDGSHHQTFKAALHHLVEWVTRGVLPPQGARIETAASDVPGGPVRIVRDSSGNAVGGIRTPSVDVPIAALSGEPVAGCSQLCALFGSTRTFDADQLAALYSSPEEYVRLYAASLDAAVAAGHILPDEAATMSVESFEWSRRLLGD